ncbi:MAG: NAD-dependent epimerase/dehydratase family protein [Elusimicrobiales bacterium]
MKVLFTGICGFVGNTLARAWAEASPGDTVFGADNFIRAGSELNRDALRKLGIKVYHGDIRVASDFETLPAADLVIDAAANASVLAGVDGRTSSRQLTEHNLLGTINILEYCKKHSSGLILLSTSRVYSIAALAGVRTEDSGAAFRLSPDQVFPAGLGPEGVRENFSTSQPLSLYGSTKLASEILALEYGEAFGFPVWINRCGVFAGAGQFGRADQGIFSFWINSYLRRRPLKYIGFAGTGRQVRDCLHPRDLLPLLRRQAAAGEAPCGRIFNLGGGTAGAMSLAELSAWCAERFGPHEVSRDPATRAFDIPWMVMDSALARKAWDWRPQTPLAGILEEIALHAEKNPGWLDLSGDL